MRNTDLCHYIVSIEAELAREKSIPITEAPTTNKPANPLEFILSIPFELSATSLGSGVKGIKVR